MRKIAFLLSLMLGLGFAACEKQDIAPVEPVFPSPEAVVVDDDACGKGKIALLFDGTAAIKAGAESFTATLTPTEETEGAAIALTRKVSHSKACNPVFENVPNGVTPLRYLQPIQTKSLPSRSLSKTLRVTL